MEGTPFGRYRLVDLLGRGGMGEVWRAYDPEMNRVVALKVLPPNFAGDQVFEERFRREARSAAGLDEPHVVPIYESGEIEGRLYVTMRLIRGQDLQALVKRGPLEPARAVNIVEQIASALAAAHEVGLVHRDVKPSNILVTADDFAYLIDFGIARAAGEVGLTSTGAAVGTWAYMAPERLNAGSTDARVDIYALACVLHEALTGQRPYPGDSLEQQIVGHLTAAPPRPSALQPKVPERLDAVIATGMAKNPDQRYATSKGLARAARAALTTPMREPGKPPAPSSAPQTHRAPHPPHLAQRPSPTPPPRQPPRPAPGERQSSPSAMPTHWQAPVPARPAPAPPPHIPPQPLLQPPMPPSPRPNRHTMILIAAVTAAIAVLLVVIVVFVKSAKHGESDSGTASPASTTSTTSPVDASSTTPTGTPTQRLLAMVPSDLHCRANSGGSEFSGSLAVVGCDSGAAGITVSYGLFPNATALESYINLVPPGGFQPCPGRGQSPSEWHKSADPQTAGKVVCWSGRYVDWSIDPQLVIGRANGPSTDLTYGWWAARYQ
jgi:serine/threonine protein kinase